MNQSLAQLNKRFFLGCAIRTRIKANDKYLNYVVSKAQDCDSLPSLSKIVLNDLKNWSAGSVPSFEAQLCLKAIRLIVGDDDSEAAAAIESGLSSLTEVTKSLSKGEAKPEADLSNPESDVDLGSDSLGGNK